MYNLELKPLRNFWGQSLLDRELDKLFDTSYNTDQSYTPPCEIVEEERRFIISMDIPGMKKEDIQLEVKDQQLYIWGERKWERPEAGRHILRKEKRYGKFSRVFQLNQQVKADHIEAKMEDGVLEIFVPKEEKSQTRKIIIGQKRDDSLNQ